MLEISKTIELDLDKEQELYELTSEIRKKKIKVGQEEFYLKLLISHSIADTVYAGYLLLLTTYFTKLIGKSQKDKFENIYYNATAEQFFLNYFKNFDISKLESKIEKEFKVRIDLEKKNPLDEVFGIWKNENISLEKIREKAWQRDN